MQVVMLRAGLEDLQGVQKETSQFQGLICVAGWAESYGLACILYLTCLVQQYIVKMMIDERGWTL